VPCPFLAREELSVKNKAERIITNHSYIILCSSVIIIFMRATTPMRCTRTHVRISSWMVAHGYFEIIGSSSTYTSKQDVDIVTRRSVTEYIFTKGSASQPLSAATYATPSPESHLHPYHGADYTKTD
jgi:hypothetical protein